MNKFNTKLSAAVAMAVVIATTLAPAAMADTVNITENGINSNNTVNITNTNGTTVNQGNETLFVNGVLAGSGTGGNTANGNTGGGNVNVTSGNATTNITINNGGSSNDAALPDCGCQTPNTTVNVDKNGVNSKTTVKVVNSNTRTVNQGNRSAFINLVGARSRTGNNKANGNTGGGNVNVKSGNAVTNINIDNAGSSNVLH